MGIAASQRFSTLVGLSIGCQNTLSCFEFLNCALSSYLHDSLCMMFVFALVTFAITSNKNSQTPPYSNV